MHTIRVVDSHTAGEPTRVVVCGGPDFGHGSVPDQLQRFRNDFAHFRAAVVNEPRGSDVLVGAWLVPPVDQASVAGVIFFNNVGWLGMCGHGMIGVVVTLGYLGRIQPGDHQLETPVGTVRATWHSDGSVSVVNVPSYRQARSVTVQVEGVGRVTGDVAWGGNWFYLVDARSSSCRGRMSTDCSISAGGFARRSTSRAFLKWTTSSCLARRKRRATMRQLCALPGPRLRPFAVRHGHECQVGLSGSRRQVSRRHALGAGKCAGQHLHGSLPLARSPSWQHRTGDHRIGVHPH